MNPNKIWTFGHSTRSEEEFLRALNSFGIKLVADIRRHPTSQRYPHFKKKQLEQTLPANGIRYQHLPGLGGMRKPLPESINVGLRNSAFRGFADHMKTFEFRQGIENLVFLAEDFPVVCMCAERDWRKCHRFLISDYLDVHGFEISHIIDDKTEEKHLLSKKISVIDGQIIYS